MQRTAITQFFGAVVIVASACVYTPESGAAFDPGESIRLRGLASHAGATVLLFGLDKSRGEWVELGQTTADVTPHEFHDKRTLYNWDLDLRLDEREDWRCLLSTSCDFPSEGVYELRLQLREVDGQIERLFTYDDGGFECWWDRYREGEDLLSAYWPCRAEAYEELRLYATIVL